MKRSITLLLAALALCMTAGAKPKKNEVKTMALNARNKSIVEISAYIAVSNLDCLKGAIGGGLDAGLTVNEIGEICVQSYAYVGFPRSLLSEAVLTEVIRAREAKGEKLNWGEAAKSVPADLDKYEPGREKINALFGMEVKQSRPTATDYNAATDIFLKEHLFTDIFYRGVLTDKERELATATMLGALGNVNPMFAAHTNGAFHAGNSAEELRDMAALLGVLIGKSEGKNAEQIVAQVVK